MKRLLLLATAAVMTLGASADWYLVGDKYGWTDNAANKLTATGNANEYAIKVSTLSGAIKIKEGGSSWSTSFGSNGAKLKEGVSYKANKDGGNISVDGVIQDATLTINTSTYTIMASGDSEENDYSVIYLVGDFGSGWSLDGTSYPLSLKEGSTTEYVGTYKLNAGATYFKMKAGTYVYGTGGNDIAVTLGTAYTASQGGDSFYLGAGTYNFSFTLVKNADTGKLVVTADGPITYPDHLYLFGQVNGEGWAPNNYVAMTTVSEGLYEVKDVLIGNAGSGLGYFSFASGYAEGASDDDWLNVGTRYGAKSPDTPVTIGEAMPMVGGENSFSINSDQTYSFTVNLKEMTLLVDGEVIPVDDNATFGLVGTVNNWSITAPLEMTQESGNEFTYTFASLPEGAKFKVAKLGTYATEDAAWAATFGAEGEPGATEAAPVDVTVGSEMYAWIGSSNDFNVAKALTDVKITFTYDANPGAPSLLLVEGTEETPDDPEPDRPQQDFTANYNFTAVPTDFTDEDFQSDPTAKNNSFVDVTDHPFVQDGVTLTLTGGGTVPRFYKTVTKDSQGEVTSITYDLRLYKAPTNDANDPGKMTITAPQGCYIASVAINSASAKSTANLASLTYGSDFEANSAYTTPTGMKTSLQVLAKAGTTPGSITFSAGKNTRIGTVDVEVKHKSSMIESVASDLDEAAPVEYYNLQGIRVANPSAGVYIMRQGSKASKVLIH